MPQVLLQDDHSDQSLTRQSRGARKRRRGDFLRGISFLPDPIFLPFLFILNFLYFLTMFLRNTFLPASSLVVAAGEGFVSDLTVFLTSLSPSSDLGLLLLGLDPWALAMSSGVYLLVPEDLCGVGEKTWANSYSFTLRMWKVAMGGCSCTSG